MYFRIPRLLYYLLQHFQHDLLLGGLAEDSDGMAGGGEGCRNAAEGVFAAGEAREA